jgi:hypothetical protein
VLRRFGPWLLAVPLLGIGTLLPLHDVAAQTTVATIGILQGGATLIRQSTRYALAEGSTLAEGDIVETPAGAFAQIEFGDGTLLGVGESSRMLISPRLGNAKTTVVPRLYLIEGWLKVRLPKPEMRFGIVTPQLEIDPRGAALVARVQAKAFAVFAEAGAAQVVQRDGARISVALKSGEFAQQAAGADKPVVSNRIDQAFLQQLPKMFREPLPPRAALYAKRPVSARAVGPVSYPDVAAWLRTEGPLRLGLSRQWRGRAADRQFRADVAANLSAHMEWERVLYPERFLPKKPVSPASAPSAPGAASAP